MRDGDELFRNSFHPVHHRYGAVRAYLYEGKTAVEIGNMFGYMPGSVRALALKFREEVQRHISGILDLERSTA